MVLTERPSRWRNSSPSAASRRQTPSRPAAWFVAVICVSHPRWRPPADDIPPRQASPRPRSRLAAPSPRGPEPRPPAAVRDRHPPGTSNGFVRGGRPRGLVYDGHPPRPRSRHAPPYPPATRSGAPCGRPPEPSSGLVCGGRPRGLVRNEFPPRKTFRATSFAAGGPIPSPTHPSAARSGVPGEIRGGRPRGRPLALFAAAVRGSRSRRLSPADGVSLRRVSLAPRSRRHGNISEQEIKQAQKYTTAAVTRASPDGVLGGVGGHPPLTTP